jgi:hypothetical protein
MPFWVPSRRPPLAHSYGVLLRPGGAATGDAAWMLERLFRVVKNVAALIFTAFLLLLL